MKPPAHVAEILALMTYESIIEMLADLQGRHDPANRESRDWFRREKMRRDTLMADDRKQREG